MSGLPFSLSEVSVELRARRLSSTEVTRELLDRIDALDGELHSFACVTPEAALREAAVADRELDRGEVRGPLHGVPVAVKNNCDIAGIATTNGLAVNDDRVAARDSTVVARLRAAGAVVLGALHQTEGAFAQHRPDRPEPVNPWRSDHWPGASSSGPGVAAAAGLCFAAIGTDTGGSIRFPAAANNLSGLKPSWGTVSRHGVWENSASMDHIGPMARTAADAAVILAAIAGPDPLDPTASARRLGNVPADGDGLHGMRIGFDQEYNEYGQDTETLRTVDAAAATLAGLGAELVPVSLPDVATVVEDWLPLSGVEMAAAHADVPASERASYGPALSGLIELGLSESAGSYFRRTMRRHAFTERLAVLFTTVDLLLTPVQTGVTATVEAMRRLGQQEGDLERLVRYTAPFNLSGNPALVVPGGTADSGIPIGFQLVGRRFGELTVLRAAIAYQEATDWHRREPNIAGNAGHGRATP